MSDEEYTDELGMRCHCGRKLLLGMTRYKCDGCDEDDEGCECEDE